MLRKKWVLGLAAMLVVATGAFAMFSQTENPPEVTEELSKVRHDLKAVKSEMKTVACCTAPACNFCPLNAGKCPCGMNVDSDVGVCGECYDGWRAGQGNMPGIQPENVQRLNQEMVDQMYQMRAKHFGDGSEPHAHH